MSVSDPKISVVMTVFNGGHYVGEAVKSILNQTFRDFEFIIVDNASTDQSREIISSFSDERIILIENKENLGQTKALNVGIRRARTSYIARMDADDVSYGNRLQVQYDFLETKTEVAVVGSSCCFIDDAGNSKRTYKVPTDSLWLKSCLSGSGELTSWCVAHPSVMMRREALEEVGLYNEQDACDGYPQDYDLWMRLIQRNKFANIAEPLLKYRVRGHSESRAFAKSSLLHRFKISCQRIKYYLPDLSEQDVQVLAQMLEYEFQKTFRDGLRVFGLFDNYFARFMEGEDERHVKMARERIKLYYLPVLFISNKRLSIREFFRIIMHYPAFLFDMRFYRKIVKVHFMLGSFRRI